MYVISGLLDNVLKYLKTIGSADVIDILLVAFIIYKLMKLIRGTSAAQVVKGILLLFIITWLSGVFGLNVLNFVLGRTMELGFLALVIMFQPELRRALEHVGSSNLRAFLEPKNVTNDIYNVISRTVEACSSM